MLKALKIFYAVCAVVITFYGLIWNVFPVTAVLSTLLVIAALHWGKWRAPRPVLALASFAIWLGLLFATRHLTWTKTRTFVCKDCTLDKAQVTGQDLLLEIDGRAVRYVNVGFADAGEQTNVNHADVLAHLAKTAGTPRVGVFETTYEQGVYRQKDKLVAVDDTVFINFYYLSTHED